MLSVGIYGLSHVYWWEEAVSPSDQLKALGLPGEVVAGFFGKRGLKLVEASNLNTPLARGLRSFDPSVIILWIGDNDVNE